MRFSLKTLFIVYTFVAFWIATWASPLVSILLSTALLFYSTIVLASFSGSPENRKLAISFCLVACVCVCLIAATVSGFLGLGLMSGKIADISPDESWLFARKYFCCAISIAVFLICIWWLLRRTGKASIASNGIMLALQIAQAGAAFLILRDVVHGASYRQELEGSLFTFSEEFLLTMLIGNTCALLVIPMTNAGCPSRKPNPIS
jgi:hypothetical protein